MSWRILGPIAGALAVTGVAVALAAPGGGGVLDPVAQAANATTSARTAEFSIAGNVTAAGQSVPIDGNGAIDMKNQRMRMSASFALPVLGSVQTDALVEGGAFYLHLPDSLMQRIPFGKPWLKLDVGAVAKATGASQGNPADMLQALKGVGGSRKLGAEKVGGTATTHYRATIDPQKALARIPDAQSSGVLKQMLSSAHLGSIPIDVWVDHGGRVRRESIKFAAAGTSMDMTVNFTRYGAPVDIAPPPADQVLDARSLLGA